jgi:hypothetical protein
VEIGNDFGSWGKAQVQDGPSHCDHGVPQFSKSLQKIFSDLGFPQLDRFCSSRLTSDEGPISAAPQGGIFVMTALSFYQH